MGAFVSDFDRTGFFRERKDVSGLGPHGLDARRHGRRDYWLFDEERAVSVTRFGFTTGRDMLRRPRLGPVLRAGSSYTTQRTGPLRGQERARGAGDRSVARGVLEHTDSFGGVVALGTVD